MAEEFRYFLRTALYIGVAGIAYWFASYEAAGTVLMATLVLALLAFIGVGLTLAPSGGPVPGARSGGVLGTINRFLGLSERERGNAPLQAGSEPIPMGSPWPIIAAAGFVLVGLGLVFGLWLIVPGLAVLAGAGLGWLLQLEGH